MSTERKVKRRRRRQKGDGIIDVAKAGIARVKAIWEGVRKTASPSVRNFTAANGAAKIIKITICRQPITPAVDKLASWISGGKWDANKKALQYDKMLHLFLIMTLDNGKVIKFEKNHVPEISTNVSTGSDTMEAGTPSITWGNMLIGAEKAAGGAEKLWVYDAISQNCQYFARAVLKACGVLTGGTEKFVMQNAAAVIEGLPWFEKLARKLTDTANVVDVAINGRGKKKCVCQCGAGLMRITPAHLATAKHAAGMKKKKKLK